jgi:hypothetical protein
MSYPVHLFFFREIRHCCPVDLGVSGVMYVGGGVVSQSVRVCQEHGSSYKKDGVPLAFLRITLVLRSAGRAQCEIHSSLVLQDGAVSIPSSR